MSYYLLIILIIFGVVCATDDNAHHENINQYWSNSNRNGHEDESHLNAHIVGGHDTSIEEHPYIVSLQMKGTHFCAGSLYSPTVVVTAAHCINMQDVHITVVAGITRLTDRNGQSSEVKFSIIHPKYARLRDHDIGILILAEPFTFNDRVRSIAMAQSYPAIGTKVTAIGWGYIGENKKENSNHLQEVDVSTVSFELCRSAYAELKIEFVSKNILCAGSDEKKDACQNDSGGPLVLGDQLLGVVSFGYGCARKEYPGIYTPIPDFHNWITDILKSGGTDYNNLKSLDIGHTDTYNDKEDNSEDDNEDDSEDDLDTHSDKDSDISTDNESHMDSENRSTYEGNDEILDKQRWMKEMAIELSRLRDKIREGLTLFRTASVM